MKQPIVALFSMFCLTLALGAVSPAADESSKHFQDAAKQSTKASQVFREIMEAPDKGIPQDILEKAECVMVFPEVLKAGFIIGGRGGRGVASCRGSSGWTPPAYFNLGGGSIGLQIGAQSTDFVLLIMNKEGMNKLLGDQFELGGDISAAAGPVGRQAGASTNIRMDAKILSYSRSKGLFAGLELKGVVIKPDKDNIEAVYGKGVDAKAVLQAGRVNASKEILTFPTTLASYSVAKK